MDRAEEMSVRLRTARVLVVGDAMLDRYVFGSVDRRSPEAPEPVVRVTREDERLGGAANVAVNLKALGVQTTLLTVVGEDDAAKKLQSLLKRQGIETLLGHDRALHTIVKLRVIGRSQQLVRVDFESQPDHEVLANMLTDFARALVEHDVVLFSDYGKGGLTHIHRMIELSKKAGRPVLVDPKGSDYARYTGATVITPNRAELAHVIGQWSNEEDLAERAQTLRRQLSLSALLLTRSEEGMSLYDEVGYIQIPARAREVFDVTGAGDTVIATLAAMLACGVPLREATEVANHAGSIVVGKFGTATASVEELFG
jgi:rfaE bifunctional protein kinase chain/domain